MSCLIDSAEGKLCTIGVNARGLRVDALGVPVVVAVGVCAAVVVVVAAAEKLL